MQISFDAKKALETLDEAEVKKSVLPLASLPDISDLIKSQLMAWFDPREDVRLFASKTAGAIRRSLSSFAPFGEIGLDFYARIAGSASCDNARARFALEGVSNGFAPVRHAHSILAAGRYADFSLIPAVADLLDHPVGEISLAALYSLIMISEPEAYSFILSGRFDVGAAAGTLIGMVRDIFGPEYCRRLAVSCKPLFTKELPRIDFHGAMKGGYPDRLSVFESAVASDSPGLSRAVVLAMAAEDDVRLLSQMNLYLCESPDRLFAAHLIEYLYSADSAVQKKALRAFNCFDFPRAYPRLREMLFERDPEIRSLAAAALKKDACSGSYFALCEMAASGDGLAQSLAMDAIDAIGNDDYLDLLTVISARPADENVAAGASARIFEASRRGASIPRMQEYAHPARTFRVFVSSTFGDMKMERDALQKKVFPEVRKYCAARGYRFTAVDLRWGVPDEAVLGRKTMQICLDEIRQCQDISPSLNFIFLLGDRYGWRPLPREIPAGEFERIVSNIVYFPEISSAGGERLLKKWYRLDENSASGVYCLLPVNPADAGFRSEEAALQKIFDAVSLSLPIGEESIFKYRSSATAQEIAFGASDQSGRSNCSFGFIRRTGGFPAGGGYREMIDLDDGGGPNLLAGALCEYQKESLKKILPGRILELACDSGDERRERYIEVFCAAAASALKSAAEKRIALDSVLDRSGEEDGAHEAFALEKSNGFRERESELKLIASYVAGTSAAGPLLVSGCAGSGKTAILARTSVLLRGDEFSGSRPDVISRFAGVTSASTELTSLLKGLCESLKRLYGQASGGVEVPEGGSRGGSISSSDLAHYSRLFPKLLSRVPAERTLVVVIDAIDQVAGVEAGKVFDWLPNLLSPNVKIVVSAICGSGDFSYVSAFDGGAAGRNDGARVLKLGVFEKELALRLFYEWLGGAGRRLTGNQAAEFEAGIVKNPYALYVRMAYEEAMRLRSYDAPPRLPGSIDELSSAMFARVESSCGRINARCVLSLLSAAKNGLSEEEIIDLLSTDGEVMRLVRESARGGVFEGRAPFSIWARLYSELAPYLSQRSADGTSLYYFYHALVAAASSRRYLPAGEAAAAHSRLAGYFESRPLFLESSGSRHPNLRKLSELAFHKLRSGDIEGLSGTLTDPDYCSAACYAGMLSQLESDYRECLSRASGPDRLLLEMSGLLDAPLSALPAFAEDFKGIGERFADPGDSLFRTAAFYSFVRSEGHRLKAYSGSSPNFFIQQAAARSRGSFPFNSARRVLASRPVQLCFHLGESSVGDYIPVPSMMRVIECHSGPVSSMAVPDSGAFALTCSKDRSLCLIDLESGAAEKKFAGHGSFVNAVAVSHDGKKAVSGGLDGEVRTWDLVAQRPGPVLSAHAASVGCAAVSRDGSFAATGSSDGDILIWDLKSFVPVTRLSLQRGPLVSLDFDAKGKWLIAVLREGLAVLIDQGSWSVAETFLIYDGRIESASASFEHGLIAAGCEDGSLRLTAFRPFRLLSTIPAHKGGVVSVDMILPAIPHEGQAVSSGFAVSAGPDGNIGVWEIFQRRCVRIIPAGRNQSRFIKSLPGGRAFAACGDDGSVRIFNAFFGESSRAGMTFRAGAHSSPLSSASISSASMTALTSTLSGEVKLWDISSPALLRTLRRAGTGICSSAVSADGSRAAVLDVEGRISVFRTFSGLVESEIGTDLVFGSRGGTIVLSRDGAFAAVFDGDGGISIVDSATGADVARIRESGVFRNSPLLSSASFSDDIRYFYVVRSSGMFRSFDVETGQQAFRREITFREGCVITGSFIFCERGLLVCGWSDGGLTLFELKSMKTVAEFAAASGEAGRSAFAVADDAAFYGSRILSVAIDPEGRHLVSLDGLGSLLVREIPGGRIVKEAWFDPEEKKGQVWPVSSEEKKYLVAYNASSNVAAGLLSSSRLFSTGKRRSSAVEATSIVKDFPGHSGSVSCVVSCVFSGVFATGAEDGFIILWNDETREEIRAISAHDGPVRSLALSSGGRFLFSAGGQAEIRAWDLSGGPADASGCGQVREFTGHAGPVVALALSSDRHLLVSGSRDGTIRVWTTADARCRRVVEEYTDSLALDPAARVLYCGSRSGTIRAMDIRERAILAEYSGNTDWPCAIAVSRCGNLLAAGCRDGSLVIWKIGATKPFSIFAGHFGPVSSVRFSKDSRFVISAGRDGLVRVFHIPKLLPLILYAHDGPVTSMDVGCRDVMFSSRSGFPYFARLEGLALSALPTPRIRVMDVTSGKWEKLVSLECPSCGERIGKKEESGVCPLCAAELCPLPDSVDNSSEDYK